MKVYSGLSEILSPISFRDVPRMALSMSEQLIKPLDELHRLSRQLFQSLSPPTTKPPPPPPIEQFLECNASIASTLGVARVHQVKQRCIEELKLEILDLESKLREIFKTLEDGRLQLEEILDEADIRLDGIEKAQKAAIPYPDLLAYAQSLSAFTSAPPNMPDLSLPAAGQPPPPLFFPPFPNEEKMRRGRLNEESPLGLGLLGEAHSVGRPTVESPTRPDTSIAHFHPQVSASRHQEIQDFAFDLDLNPDL